jgi:hypothetical protein
VDHVVIQVNPQEDRSWLQSIPAVITDGVHTFDKTGGLSGWVGMWSTRGPVRMHVGNEQQLLGCCEVLYCMVGTVLKHR